MSSSDLTKCFDGDLPKQHSIRELFGSRVIENNALIRDRSVNEDIQEYGAHFGGRMPAGTIVDGSEYMWYKKHKGYSK